MVRVQPQSPLFAHVPSKQAPNEQPKGPSALLVAPACGSPRRRRARQSWALPCHLDPVLPSQNFPDSNNSTTDGDEGNQSSSQSQECQEGLKQPTQTLSAHRSAPGCCRWFGAILALRARLLHAPTRPLRAAVLQHDRVREALDPSPSQQPQINAGEFPQGRCDFNLQGLGEAAQRPDTCWLKPIVRLRPLLL